MPPSRALFRIERLALLAGPCLLLLGVIACGPTPEPVDAAGMPDAAEVRDAPSSEDAGEASCRSDRQCSAAAQVCDRSTGRCVDCVSATDCAPGEACVARECVATVPCTSSRQCPDRVCAPALGYCVDCNEDVDCGDEAVCRDNVCVPRPRPCASSRECSGLGLVCDATLGACVECVGAADCLDPELLCDRSDPVLGGRCVPRICVAETTECAGTYEERTCSSDGSSWASRSCGTGESCAVDRCAPWLCEPGSSRCLDTSRRSLCGADGRTETEASCAASTSCSEGECRPWVCSPDSSSCAGPLTRRTCDADGLGFATAPCGSSTGCNVVTGACEAQVCTPGATSCGDLLTLRTCDASGLSYTSSPCAASESCSAGACRARVCVPGTTSCDGTSRTRICNSDGLGFTTTDCGPASSCSAGACSGWVCTPGLTECVDAATRRTCAGDGSAWTTTACGASATCTGGICRAHVCSPGTTSCGDAVTRRTCSSDGLSYASTACAPGEACSAGVCARPSYGDLVRRHGAIAYWPLDTVSAGRTPDVIGGRDATVVGTVDFDEAGLHSDSGGAARMSGAGYLEVPYASVFQSAPFSIELWYRRDAVQSFALLVSCRDNGAFGWDFFLHEARSHVLAYELGVGGAWVETPGMVPVIGEVVHIVGTYDGTTARFYWNGSLVSSIPAVLAASTRPLRIAAGRSTAGDPSGHAAGAFDEVAFYPRALTATEIAEHTAAGASPTSSSVVRLDGDGDGVELPRNADYGAVGNRFTMELWFKPASADTNDYGVLYTRRAHYGEYGLNYSEDDNGLVHFEVYVDGADSLAGGMWLYSRTRPTVGVWHHAAGVVDGRAVRLYLDGVLEAEATAPGDITWQPDEPRATLHDEYRTFVGYTRSPGDGGMRYIGRFTGDVDDVHISRVARYTGASFVPPRLAIADANTVGLWTFEEPSGATAEDHSPGGTLDGTILGAVRVPGGR